MQELIRGRVIKMPFDNVSTDVIAPSRYRSTTGEDPELLALRPWIMGALRPGPTTSSSPAMCSWSARTSAWDRTAKPPCASSSVGRAGDVADSAARIWFRNAIAFGLPVFQLKDATKLSTKATDRDRFEAVVHHAIRRTPGGTSHLGIFRRRS